MTYKVEIKFLDGRVEEGVGIINSPYPVDGKLVIALQGDVWNPIKYRVFKWDTIAEYNVTEE